MKYDFLTIGGATEDITVYTLEGKVIDNPTDVLAQKLIAFEFGAKLKVEHAYVTFGGGAANAAVCLGQLGFKVGALVAVGTDERGERVIANFKKRKVDTAPVQRIKGETTGFSFLLVGQGHEHVVFSNRAANNKLAIGPKEDKLLNQAEWVYMTSLSGKWQPFLNRVFRSKAKIAWNPGHIQLHAGFKAIGQYLKQTDMLTINQDEAIELVVTNPKYKNLNPEIINDPRNLLEMIRLYGPKIVVITRGKDGADAYDGERFYHQEILHEKARVDTTGVGDAFGSTFTAGLKLFDGDIQKSMALAVTNTASVISLQGAQNGLLSRGVILKKLKANSKK
jgi:sugar/nucleoside kinase (ribokinase family)